MPQLTNTELNNYVDRIKLNQLKKSSYASQIDNLIKNVRNAINETHNTKVTRAIRVGSWKKGTALAPKGDYPLDVDIVFFTEIESGRTLDAERLREEVISVLCNAYPNKDKSDFTNGSKTVGVVFRGSGLEVDIVPFVPDSNNSMYGRQPQKKLNSDSFRTSVDGQLEFISKVKELNSCFVPTVRILKNWRNYKELELPSFSIELIVAHLLESNNIRDPQIINNLMIYFFEILGGTRTVEIFFPNAIGYCSDDLPWIADPTNNENNTLSCVSSLEWADIASESEIAYETIIYAQTLSNKNSTIGLWKEILGPTFSIDEV